MIEYNVSKEREWTKMLAPHANFDGRYTFYYDETNNIRKFYVRENDFNATFTANFVLGGLAHEGSPPNVEDLIRSFRLQSSVKEVKLKHLAKGEFLDCMTSERITLLFENLKESNLYIHYSSLNILYWALVDIVDSAIANSEVSQQLGPEFGLRLKNDLYKLCRLEIESVIDLFYAYEYPNIKADRVTLFIADLTSLFDEYIDTKEFHFGLESLRQILKESKKKGTLPFIMGGEDYVLLKDLSHFYLRPVYLFKNSVHIFDEEESVAEVIKDYKLVDGQTEIKNYSFVNSETNRLIQLSDVFIGILGKLHSYLNTSDKDKIINNFEQLSKQQEKNVDLLIDLIDKSADKNIGFLHATDSFYELSKMNLIRSKRGKP
ncbi:MAG: DUF3800 domain-containing protein [Bacteroidetes bacterium]|nr:DUF3800 domain-containing protein [Bacteroidota bacterium]